MMLHEVNQLSSKKCANLQCGSSSAPNPTFLNSTFLLFLASIFPYLTTNLSILYDHFLHISKTYLLFSSHSTKIFIQVLILTFFFNLHFLFFCACLCHYSHCFQGTERHRSEATKFRYLRYQKWSRILGSCFLVLVFISLIQSLYWTLSGSLPEFHLFTSFYTHHSAALAWLKPININLQ